MAAEVARLRTAASPIMDVDHEVVERLEWLLEHARAGAIQGLLFATVEADGAGSIVAIGHGYAGEGVRQNCHASLGALVSLQRRFMAEREL